MGLSINDNRALMLAHLINSDQVCADQVKVGDVVVDGQMVFRVDRVSTRREFSTVTLSDEDGNSLTLQPDAAIRILSRTSLKEFGPR